MPCGPLGGSGALALCLSGMGGQSVAATPAQGQLLSNWYSWRTPFLSPAAGRFWLLVIGDSSDLLAASTGSVL
jgi:hypothetical protein